MGVIQAISAASNAMVHQQTVSWFFKDIKTVATILCKAKKVFITQLLQNSATKRMEYRDDCGSWDSKSPLLRTPNTLRTATVV